MIEAYDMDELRTNCVVGFVFCVFVCRCLSVVEWYGQSVRAHTLGVAATLFFVIVAATPSKASLVALPALSQNCCSDTVPNCRSDTVTRNLSQQQKHNPSQGQNSRNLDLYIFLATQ